MTRPAEPITPVQIESKLRHLIGDLSNRQETLAKARDAETETEIALRRARAIAAHSEACPVPLRGGFTVGQRDAWIDAQVADEHDAHDRATTMRETALDALRTAQAIAELAQSLNASVRLAYSQASRS
jgi:hypothetical protein